MKKALVKSIAAMLIAGMGMLALFPMGAGAQWVQTSLNTYYVAALSTMGNNIFAGTNSGGVFLSTDNGNNWTAVNSGLTNNTVNVLTVSGNNIFAGTNGGVFLSKNNGTSWTAVNTGLTNDTVNALAVSGSNIFAATNGGVFLSADSGNNWTATANTSTTRSLWANGPNIFAGMSDLVQGTTYPNPCPSYLCSHGVLCSTNSGTSWNLDSCGFPVPCCCYSANICYFCYQGAKCLTVKGNYLFAGFMGFGVFFSNNNGGPSCWTQVNSGLTNTAINALLAVNDTDLFAGTNGGGVFLTATNGSNWNAFNTGLPNMDIKSLAVGGNYLFAGSYTSGVWRRPLSDVAVKNPQNSLPEQFSFNLLTHNRSNLTITFSLPRADKVMVKIYNLSGHLIATLLDKPMAAGPHNVSWDTRNVASGCYMVRMQAGQNSQVKAFPLFR